MAAREDIGRRVDEIEGDLVALRRHLHQYPELGGVEHATADLVARRLWDLGLEVRTGVGGLGVVAEVSGESPGPTLLLRADMDALPVTERTGLPYASSVPGVMHACGHDAHTAALLGTATVLAGLRDRLHGTVRFCFQPAEETLSGAAPMVAAGVLEGVTGVAGAHVLSTLPFGTVAAAPGPFLAGADLFEVTVRGKGGHAGRPHESVDPVYVACHLVVAAQEIVSRETKPGEPVVLTFGAIEGGRAANIVVEEVVLKGTVRWFEASEHQRILGRLEAVIQGICETFRATGSLRLMASTPPTVNDPDAVARLGDVTRATGRAEVTNPGQVTFADDVAVLLQGAPGVYALVGARSTGAPHHHPDFAIDERAIGLVCELLVRYALSFCAADPA